MADRRGSIPGEHRGGRKVGTPNRYRANQAVHDTLKRLKCDPIEGLANIAMGDVVALGMMTQEELEAPAVYGNVRGRKILLIPSGRMIANRLIDAHLRHRAHSDLSRFVAPQLSTIAHTDADGKNLPMTPQVLLYVPENGRR